VAGFQTKLFGKLVSGASANCHKERSDRRHWSTHLAAS
jgi:hypothetical protein